MKHNIQLCSLENIERYGEIYAAAFSGEPWNDPWKPEDAAIHIRELMESKTAYGLEYVIDGEVAGFILGTSMLFHYGRTFEINDLAVDPIYQGRGIAKELMERMLSDIKEKGISSHVRSFDRRWKRKRQRMALVHTGVAMADGGLTYVGI